MTYGLILLYLWLLDGSFQDNSIHACLLKNKYCYYSTANSWEWNFNSPEELLKSFESDVLQSILAGVNAFFLQSLIGARSCTESSSCFFPDMCACIKPKCICTLMVPAEMLSFQVDVSADKRRNIQTAKSCSPKILSGRWLCSNSLI